jgi:hypothetical protein
MIGFLFCALVFLLLVNDVVSSEKPICSPSNLKLVNASDGEWRLLPDGTFHYEFDHCRLRRFTLEDTAKCLKGTHLVFVGDSLSRYFYLSLSYLFATGKWSRKFAKLPAHPSLSRSILSEKDFQNWSRFYHKSNKILSNEKTTFEICDCFRNDSRPFISTTPGLPDQGQDCRENRHLRYIPESSNLDDQENDVRISYLQWYGLMPMRYDPRISVYPRNSSFPTFTKALNERLCPKYNQSFVPLSYHCSEQRGQSQELWFYGPQDFSHQLFDCDNQEYEKNPHTKCQKFEKVMLIPMGATHVMLNAGWHSGLHHMDKNFLPKLIHAADHYFPSPGPDGTSPSSSSSSSSASGKYQPNMQLAKVTWRGMTSAAQFQADYIADDLNKKIKNPKLFDYFDIFPLMKKLRHLEDLISSRNYAKLKETILLSSKWPKELVLNVTAILTIWVDTAHLEPWAYEEIHMIFLNSVCPLNMV